jgi:hypothetical protein
MKLCLAEHDTFDEKFKHPVSDALASNCKKLRTGPLGKGWS